MDFCNCKEAAGVPIVNADCPEHGSRGAYNLLPDVMKVALLTAAELTEKDQDGGELYKVPVIIKYFHPLSSARWYAVSGEEYGDDFIFFGLADLGVGFPELGYFSLNELKSVNVMGLGIERDLYFHDKTLSDIMVEHGLTWHLKYMET